MVDVRGAGADPQDTLVLLGIGRAGQQFERSPAQYDLGVEFDPKEGKIDEHSGGVFNATVRVFGGSIGRALGWHGTSDRCADRQQERK